jgi:DNA-binding NarL/FixJ family response regulator
MRVAIVEDDQRFRDRFVSMVEHERGWHLQGAFCRLGEARLALADSAPDVLLVDLGLPDGDGADLIRDVCQRSPKTNAMVITIFGDDQHVFRALEAGATGYLLKDASNDDMVASIKSLIAGGSPISPMIARKLLGLVMPAKDSAAQSAPKSNRGPFSAREHEILCIIARGFTSDEIAKLLSISTHTVIAHIKNIYQKLAVHSRAEAVFEARQMGFID